MTTRLGKLVDRAVGRAPRCRQIIPTAQKRSAIDVGFFRLEDLQEVLPPEHPQRDAIVGRAAERHPHTALDDGGMTLRR